MLLEDQRRHYPPRHLVSHNRLALGDRVFRLCECSHATFQYEPEARVGAWLWNPRIRERTNIKNPRDAEVFL